VTAVVFPNDLKVRFTATLNGNNQLIDQWVGSNIDLAVLGRKIEEFFVANQFAARLVQRDGKYIIDASSDIIKVRVNVYGQPDDFSVEFVPSKKSQGFSLSMIMSYLTTMFGGGSFLLYDIKLQEAIRSLEQVFWKEVDLQVAELSKPAVADK
jgi:hypothetical protein